MLDPDLATSGEPTSHGMAWLPGTAADPSARRNRTSSATIVRADEAYRPGQHRSHNHYLTIDLRRDGEGRGGFHVRLEYEPGRSGYRYSEAGAVAGSHVARDRSDACRARLLA